LQEKFGNRKVTQAKLLYSNPIKFSVAFVPKRGTKSYNSNHNSGKESCVLLITRRQV